MVKERIIRRLTGHELMIEIAWNYYHDGLNQNEIADKLGISRSTVVNQLQEVRAREYVQILLKPSVFEGYELAEKLRNIFGLTGAIVIPNGSEDAYQALLRTTRGAANWLPSLLAPGDLLGVSWGQTIFEVSEAIHTTQIDDLTVIQLVGSRSTAYGFEAETCSSNIASRLGARCINLHAPLIISDAELAHRLRSEPTIHDQLQAVNNCNKTIFAAGSCLPDSHVVSSGVVGSDLLAEYVQRGAVGVICGRFIDGQGEPISGEIDDRMIGVNLHNMRNKELSLLVSSGPDKAIPTLAALRGGYVTHLATCTETAKLILQHQ